MEGSLKWLFRIGIIVLFCLSLFWGYRAKKAYEKNLKPKVKSYHSEEYLRYYFDAHGHAYSTVDDYMTLYVDDPELHENTLIPHQGDLTPPDPAMYMWRPKDTTVDEFEIKGKLTRDKDDKGSKYLFEQGAYDGVMPGGY